MVNSSLVAALVLLGIAGILLGFFRHLFLKILIVLVIEIVILVIFPGLLSILIQIVGSLRSTFS